MDSAFLSAAGVETVVMGPRGTGAHADEEWVEIDSVAEMALILAKTAATYCE
jgi:acetylornithine deacetylase